MLLCILTYVHTQVYILRIRTSLVTITLFSQDKETLSKLLMETEEWLYGDGEDESKSVYQDKLSELKVCTYMFYEV